MKGNRVLPQQETDRISSNTFFPVLCERDIYQLRGGASQGLGGAGCVLNSTVQNYSDNWLYMT